MLGDGDLRELWASSSLIKSCAPFQVVMLRKERGPNHSQVDTDSGRAHQSSCKRCPVTILRTQFWWGALFPQRGPTWTGSWHYLIWENEAERKTQCWFQRGATVCWVFYTHCSFVWSRISAFLQDNYLLPHYRDDWTVSKFRSNVWHGLI